jgi:hypothetical protein
MVALSMPAQDVLGKDVARLVLLVPLDQPRHMTHVDSQNIVLAPTPVTLVLQWVARNQLTIIASYARVDTVLII